MKTIKSKTVRRLLKPGVKLSGDTIRELANGNYPILFPSIEDSCDWWWMVSNGFLDSYSEQQHGELYARDSVAAMQRVMQNAYSSPQPMDPTSILLRFMESHDYTMMVPKSGWSEIDQRVRGKGFKSAGPKLPEYYYTPRFWDRHNSLIDELLGECKLQNIPNSQVEAFKGGLVQLRNEFRRDNEKEFNFRSNIARKLQPFLLAQFLRTEQKVFRGKITGHIRNALKRQRFDQLKRRLWDDPLYAAVFIGMYYDPKQALSTETTKRGRLWTVPKEALASYLIRISELFKSLGLNHAKMWAVRFVNSLANDDIYKETPIEQALINADDAGIITLSNARDSGMVLIGEIAFRDDLRRERAKLSKLRTPLSKS